MVRYHHQVAHRQLSPPPNQKRFLRLKHSPDEWINEIAELGNLALKLLGGKLWGSPGERDQLCGGKELARPPGEVGEQLRLPPGEGQPFSGQIRVHLRQPRDVAAGPRQARDFAGADRGDEIAAWLEEHDVAGYVIVRLALKLRGAYFVLLTISFAGCVSLVSVNWMELTNGPLGVPGVPPVEISLPGLPTVSLRSKAAYYYLVLVAVGIEPNLDLPRALGLPIEGGGVRVDEGLRAAGDVYVGGDVALHQHPVLGRAIRVEHWEVAKNQGRGIAASIADGHAPYTKIPYFWSDQYDVNLEYRGHASGDDAAVWRGDREGRAFSVFYLRDGVVEGVLSMNDSKTNEAGGKLVESRRRIDPASLGNPAVDLAELAGTKT